MKLDPGMHIGMHLVFFGKSGVTIQKNGVIHFQTGAQQHKMSQNAVVPHTGRLGVSTRAALEVSRRPSRTFPRRMHHEAPLFLPMPRVARRPRRARAPCGPPVRPRSLVPADAVAILRLHLRRHQVVTGESTHPI
jgi:hypothetical protein